MDLIETARTLRRELRDLRFAAPVDYVYSPLEWGWAQQRYGTADEFFARYFVLNYCPLAFLEASVKTVLRTNSRARKENRCSIYAIARWHAQLRGCPRGM